MLFGNEYSTSSEYYSELIQTLIKKITSALQGAKGGVGCPALPSLGCDQQGDQVTSNDQAHHFEDHFQLRYDVKIRREQGRKVSTRSVGSRSAAIIHQTSKQANHHGSSSKVDLNHQISNQANHDSPSSKIGINPASHDHQSSSPDNKLHVLDDNQPAMYENHATKERNAGSFETHNNDKNVKQKTN